MKILKKILLLFLVFFPLKSFALSTPVENVFRDIDKDYKYYNQLQTLYDKGMFFPDENGKFNPKKLLTRDEFIGIVSEVSCKKCIQPNVGYDFFSKYNNSKPFFDIKKENKYFYCIASSLDLGQVKGYYKGDSCENGTKKVGEAPFCPQNTIILEEALAIMLRVSNILSNSEADFLRAQIKLGIDFPDLSSDVKAKLSSGGVYSFYPDFREALNYEIFEYDTSGNKKTYKLLEKIGNKLNPKKSISKEEFLKMAYVLLKGNSCIEDNFYDIGLKIKIFNKTCNEKISARCSLARLRGGEKVFDFFADIGLTPLDKVSKKEGYIWRFYDFKTGKEIVRYGRYLDNYDFLKDGKYRVFLRVNTDLGYTGEVYNDINIYNGKISKVDNNLRVSIDANPIIGQKGLNVNFRGIVSNSSAISSYFWEYGDGETSYGLNNNHIYKEPGTYEVKLTITDSNGNKSTATTLIKVYDNQKDTDGDGVVDVEDYEKNTKKENIYKVCTKEDIEKNRYNCKETDLGVYNPNKKDQDSDGDGVLDSLDSCPYIFGLIENNGCPKVVDGDSDGDGVIDEYDRCENLPGPLENSGCPIEKKDNTKDVIQVANDSDGDGVLDRFDSCILLKGIKENYGCPVFEDSCSSNSDCPAGYSCFEGFCSLKDFAKNCEYSGGNLFYGNVVCDTCPCQYSIDFSSNIRKCDIIFPAITSPDETTIYSKGDYYRVGK